MQDTIHGLFGGISQQAPALRLPDQLTDQTNFRNTVVKGLTKRPGSEFVSEITPPVNQSTSTSVQPMSHVINRDSSERYMVLFFDDATEPIVVLDEDGAKQTVTYGAAADKTYVQHEAIGDISAATLDDTTVIAKKSETVALEATIQPAQTPRALVWVKSFNGANSSGHVTVDGTAKTWSIVAPSATNSVAGSIASSINSISGFTASTLHASESSVVLITKDDNTDFTITSGDNWGNQSIAIIKDGVDKVADLPPEAPDGFIVTVRGEADIHFTFSDTSSTWSETMAPGIKTTFDGATMPRKLVRTAPGTFHVSEISWDLRTVGDDDTTPIPSIVGNTISNVNFYKDRLVLVANQGVVMSRSGDHWNLWPQSAAESLDDDPIDVVAAHSTVALLTHSLAFEDSLLLFSHDYQFSMHSGDQVFSPNNVQIDQTTRAGFSGLSAPVVSGSNAYFVGEQANASTVWEYFVDPGSITRDVADVTAHVPSLIPKNIQLTAASPTYDMLFFYSPDEATTLYVYQFYWRGDEKQMSAWTKWTLPGPLQGLGILGEKLFASWWGLSSGGNYTKIQTASYDLNPTANTSLMTCMLHGDLFIDGDDIPGGDVTYNGGPETTDIDLGFDTGDGTWTAVAKNANTTTYTQQDSTGTSGSTVTFAGDLKQFSDPFAVNWTDHYFIRQASHSASLSPWYPRDRNGQGIAASTVRAKGLTVSTNDSGPYTLTVTPQGRSAQTQMTNSPFINGFAHSTSLDTKARRHAVKCDPQTSTLVISDSSPMPLAVDSITWDGTANRLRRYN